MLLALATAPVGAQGPATLGRWTTGSNWGNTAVHAVIMPCDSADFTTQILWWRGKEQGVADTLFGGVKLWRFDGDTTNVLFPAGNFASRPLIPPTQDIFCSSHAPVGPSGFEILISGGTELDGSEVGMKHNLLYRPGSFRIDPMVSGATPVAPLADRRWYPSTTQLSASGTGASKLLITSGSRFFRANLFGGSVQSTALPQKDSVYHFAPMLNAAWDGAGRDNNGDDNPPPLEGHTMVGASQRDNYTLFGGLDNSSPRGVTRKVRLLYRTDGAYVDGYPVNWIPITANVENNGQPPVGRWLHGAARNADFDMVLFGGLDSTESTTYDDLWVLRNSYEAPNYVYRWHPIPGTRMDISQGWPGPRSGHQMVWDSHSGRILVYGGSSTASADPTDPSVYELKVTWGGSNYTAVWKRLTVQGTPPPARKRFGMAWDPNHAHYVSNDTLTGHRMFVHGGEGAGGQMLDDLWVLWTYNDGSLHWQPVNQSAARPSARRGAALCYEPSLSRVVISGGETAPGSRSDQVWMVSLKNFFSDSNPALSWTAWPALHAPLAGHTMHLEHGPTLATVPELYDLTTNTMTSLPAISTVQRWYPFGFLVPDANSADPRVFFAGPDRRTWWMYPTKNPPQRSEVSPDSSAFRTVGGSAVMYRIGRVMKCGTRDDEADGSVATPQTWVIDLFGNARWRRSADMDTGRVNQNLTLLPTGDVLGTGGTRSVGNGHEDPPDFTRTAQRWSPATETWTTLALDQWNRGYHSMSVLLPDGRVLSGGGNTNRTHMHTVNLFSPPYLFNTDGTLRSRPRILGTRARLAPGDTFSVVTDQTVDHFALLKAGSVTHAFNQTQRYLRLEAVTADPVVSPPRRRLRIPADADSVPPGPYLLFAMKADGTPSIARWLFLGEPPHIADMADRERPGAVTLDAESECSGAGMLRWAAPADDSTFAVTGSVASYDVRYRTNAFNTWEDFGGAVPLPNIITPGIPGSVQQQPVTTLADGSYNFVVISRDDRNAYLQNTSPMSNVLTLHLSSCGGGGGTGGDPGDELRDPIVHRGPEQSSMGGAQRTDGGGTASSFASVSLLSGVPDGTWASDRVALPREPVLVDGRRMVRVYRGATGTADLDEVSLVALDHAAGTAAEVLPTRAVAGVRVEPLAIHDAEGRDVASRFTGDPSACFVGDLGDAVTLTFPPAAPGAGPAALLVSGRAVRRPSGEPGGLLVQLRDGESWRTVTLHQPRERLGESVVDSVDGDEVRLVFQGNGALLRVARLVPGESPVRHDLTAPAARSAPWTRARRRPRASRCTRTCRTRSAAPPRSRSTCRSARA